MVTHEEIRKIAALAKLSVSPEELEGLTQDMNEIIGFADTVSAAAADAGEFDNINGLSNVFRSDDVAPSYPREDILRNAPRSEDGFFLVRRHG